MQKIAELISEDIKERISEKLSEIEKSSNLTNFDVSTIVSKITNFTTIEHVSIQNDLWKDIAKLSVDFYLDFDYYKQFTFQSKFSCKEYHDALKSLGFKEIDGFWKSCSKPSKPLVINYVVQSCIYRTIMMKMNEGDCLDANLHEVMTTNDTTELIDCCPFCDKNLNGVHNCELCNATAEEIENLRNQNKIIENKRNQIDNDESVVGVVKNDVSSSEHVDSVNLTGNSLTNSDNNTNENTLTIDGNSKSISNINFSEENKQKINQENENGGGGENVDIERRFTIANVATIVEKSNNLIRKRGTRKISFGNDKIRQNKVKTNNNNKDNNMKKEGMIDSWNCWYEKCKKRNDENVKYCKYCGLDKSANRERGAAVDMDKYGEKQQVWICYSCGYINNDLSRSFCKICFESKVEDKFESKINVDVNKSDEKQQVWTCDNNNEDNNVNKEGMFDSWICWYRFCENKNPGNVKYCKYCGLDRDADKINIGAPMWWCKEDVPREIWICDKCFNFNDISHYSCQHKISQYRTCYNKNKYNKWCYKCNYQYNHESNKICIMCKEKLGWTFL